ncbi:flagellar filament capping protein FliD [Schlesneria paludicola]|uniref:flagellar filament capping protein FliD n=1 Tax=Schlesneria paludicola TaxID=360056 RepID=UPI00029AF582|nr:flagellar filament capping protein FliD [Schlesneria paludicola]
MGNVTFTGLASGLDSTALISNIQRFSQARITALQSTISTTTSQQTALQNVQTKLQTLQTLASQLGQSQGSVFDSKTVSSSNSSLVTAAAGSGAQSGVTSFRVLALAQASQIASQGFDNANSAISQGTFQIQSGSQSSTITVDSTNNTLSGLAQSINDAGIGVKATVINTGSASQPYRLMLSSNATGTDNAIKITNNLAASSNGAILPNFSTSEIGQAVKGSSYTGTSAVTSNAGPSNYTGAANDTFTFTVASGGTVGTTNGIQVNYTNSTGTQTGTLTINASDVNNPINVVDGVQITLGSGTVQNGDQFSVNVFSPTIQAATNSQIQLGSGTGAVIVQNSTNTVGNLIPGVTLSLQSADPNQTVQINVSNDVASATTQINNFVSDYNDFVSYLNDQTKYTPGVGTAIGTTGPLNGYRGLTDIKNQLAQTVLGVTAGLPATANRLGALGISPDSNGLLQVDSAQLQSALSGGVPGISFSDVKNLFGLQGQSSSSGIQFATGTSTTLPSGSTPYTVHITQAATRASVTAASPLAASTTIDSSNNTLSLSINGQATQVTLASGTYNATALAAEVQSKLNTNLTSSGGSVSVSVTNNNLVITSDRYGTASKVNTLSGSALTALGYSGSETSTGQDVAGSFVVNGVTESATGLGQILTGDSTNKNTSGLVVVSTLSPSQINPGGTDSTLTVTRGVASALSTALQSYLDPVSGQLTTIANQITKSIQTAQNDVNTQTAAMSAQQTALLQQFSALETTMANLQSLSNLLSSSFNSSGTATASAAISTNYSNLKTS